MPSERARLALSMRRDGAKYDEIANRLGVGKSQAYQLTLQALRHEARLQHGGRPTTEALNSIKRHPRRKLSTI